jgi:hypothetical protein
MNPLHVGRPLIYVSAPINQNEGFNHDRHQSALASASVARHLTRGAIGFGLIGSALVLTVSIGPVALLLAPLGMFALRGCPTCRLVGLVQTISAGRLRRNCTDTNCTLHSPTTSITTPDAP